MSGFNPNWIGGILVLLIVGIVFVIGAVATTRRKVREAENEGAHGSKRPQ